MAEPEQQDGLAFPVVEGRRGTTRTGRDVVAAAAAAVDPALAETVRQLPDWRRSYPQALVGLLDATLASEHAAVAAAEAGLAALRDRLEVSRDGATLPLGQLDRLAPRGVPEVVAVGGHGRHPGGLVVPYDDEELSGDRLLRQVDAWERDGVVEPGCAEALRAVVAAPDWLDLSDLRVAVLGAGAEMAPTELLLAWGARVLAVDVPSPAAWSRLLAAAEVGTGRMEVPLRPGTPTGAPSATPLAERAGVDLLTDLPEVLALLLPRAEGLLVGQYLYADGGRHVLVNAAADALTARLLAAGAAGVASLATPTDAYAVPEAAVAAAQRGLAGASPWSRLGRVATGGRLLAPAYPGLRERGDGARVGLLDAYVLQQGPSYALAKRAQRWRATVTRAQGRLASLTVAPMTLTRSVTKRRLLATGYAGTWRFDVEVFAPETSRALTAGLLAHDLRSPAAAAAPTGALAHPEDLPAATAAHGGLWRMPWQPRSVLPLAVLGGVPSLLGR